jgi:hypothetical protein
LFLADTSFSGEALIKTINIRSAQHEDFFDFYLSDEKETLITFSDQLKFLYEPNASILKAGAFRSIAKNYALTKIHPSTHLYTSDLLIDDFPGRIFEVKAEVKSGSKEVFSFFPERKANVITRNYPLTTEELKKKCGLKDGGLDYLIGFTGQTKKHLVVAARKK